jgi:hypothetical protein
MVETGFDGRAIVGYGLDATPLEPSETLLEPLSTGRSSKKYLGNSLFRWSFEGFLRLDMLRRVATCVRRVGESADPELLRVYVLRTFENQ